MHTHIPPDALDKFKAGDIAAALVDFENVSALEVCVCGGGGALLWERDCKRQLCCDWGDLRMCLRLRCVCGGGVQPWSRTGVSAGLLRCSWAVRAYSAQPGLTISHAAREGVQRQRRKHTAHAHPTHPHTRSPATMWVTTARACRRCCP